MGLMIGWGMGSWYYDMAGGWFRDEGIMKEVAEVQEAYRAGLASRSGWHPDVAVFADEQSADWIHGNAFHIVVRSLNAVRAALALSGVPYDVFLLDDLSRPELADYKVYVFLNCYRLRESQVRFIEERLKRDGKTLVWMYAPGYVSDRGLSLEQTSSLVGMELAASEEPSPLACEAVVPAKHPLSEGLLPMLGQSATAIKFWVVGEGTIPLGQYVEGGELAVAAREFEGWRSVYIAPPGCLGPQLINNIARWSSAYACTSPGDSVSMNSRFISVHGVTGGRRRFNLPRPARATDLISGTVISEKTDSFEAEVPLQRTRWFRLD